MWPPGYSTHILQFFIICEAFTSKDAPSFLETGKCPTVPGPDGTKNARICPSGIAHAARLVSAGQYVDVHYRATEQFHNSSAT